MLITRDGLQLEGKVAWVTGAAAASVRPSRPYSPRRERTSRSRAGRRARSSRTAERIGAASGRRVIAVPADVTDNDAVVTAATEIAGRLGSIGILVNSAATPGGRTGSSIETVTDTELLRELDEKLVSTFRACQAAAPYMKERGWGRLIHVGGLRRPDVRQLLLAAHARARASLQDARRRAGAVRDHVECRAPGGHTRPMALAVACVPRRRGRHLRGRGRGRARVRLRDPRLLDGSDIANIVAFLASPLSVAITGESIGHRRRHGPAVTI